MVNVQVNLNFSKYMSSEKVNGRIGTASFQKILKKLNLATFLVGKYHASSERLE